MSRAGTNAIATVALVLGLAGGSYGAFKLPRNSVRSASIVDGQVKAADLARGAVTASKVAAGAAGRNAFAQGALPVGRIGATGPDGAKGPQGDRGARGTTVTRYRLARPTLVSASAFATTDVPMTPAMTWTQAPQETDLVAVHIHAVASGPTCVAGFGVNDGTTGIGSGPLVDGDAALGRLSGFTAPATATPRTLKVTAVTTCMNTSFLIDALELDVVRMG